MRLAKLLHKTPLLLALALPLFISAVGANQQRTITHRYLEQLKMAAVALLSGACAVIAPVLFAFAFVYLTGERTIHPCTCTRPVLPEMGTLRGN